MLPHSTALRTSLEIEPRKEFYGMAFDARAWFRATCPDASFRNPQGAIDDAKKSVR